MGVGAKGLGLRVLHVAVKYIKVTRDCWIKSSIVPKMIAHYRGLSTYAILQAERDPTTHISS